MRSGAQAATGSCRAENSGQEQVVTGAGPSNGGDPWGGMLVRLTDEELVVILCAAGVSTGDLEDTKEKLKKESYDRPFAWVEIDRSELVVLGIERRYIRALMIAFRDAMQVKFGQRFVRAMVPLEPELSARAEAKADAAAIAAEANG